MTTGIFPLPAVIVTFFPIFPFFPHPDREISELPKQGIK